MPKKHVLDCVSHYIKYLAASVFFNLHIVSNKQQNFTLLSTLLFNCTLTLICSKIVSLSTNIKWVQKTNTWTYISVRRTTYNDRNYIWEKCFWSVIRFFRLVYTNHLHAVFMNYFVASHQRAIKIFWLHISGRLRHTWREKRCLTHALESFIFIQCLQYFSPEDIADEKMSLYSFISY